MPSPSAAALAQSAEGETSGGDESTSHVQVLGREIPGRPLLVRGAHSIHFHRYTPAEHNLRSSVGGEDLEVRQYIVKTTKTIRAQVRSLLQRLVGRRAMRYLPHDSFVVSMDDDQARAISDLRGCIVYHLPWVRPF